MTNPLIFDIKRASTVDGPGLRTVVFFKGCNLDCSWCHNPEGKSSSAEIAYFSNKCISCGVCKNVCQKTEACTLCGICADSCPGGARKIYGKAQSIDGLLELIERDRPYYDASGGGVTFSGGECMLQIDFLEEILIRCKNSGIHTAVDTAGHVPFECFERILPYTDLFLYDVKCYDSKKHKKYTGVSNELILSNLSRLLSENKSVWVRIPVIPTVNDSVEEMEAIRRFLDTYGKPENIELLPYHTLGEDKCLALGKKTVQFEIPKAETMKSLNAIFKD